MALDYDMLEAVTARTGSDVEELWCEQIFAEAMTYLRLLAPCKRRTWREYSDLPEDVQTVVVSVISRQAMNPRNIRQETLGEYSYTLASGAGYGLNGPFNAAEARIIAVWSACGGAVTTIQMTPPDLVNIDAPEASSEEFL